MTALNQFEKQQYLNVETFRKNGNGVKTPVWFVKDGERLFIWTEAASGKARRIRNNATVRIAPSKADGTPVGEWVSASAQVDDSSPALDQLKKLMGKKYGVAFSMFGFFGRLRKSKYTAIQIQVI